MAIVALLLALSRPAAAQPAPMDSEPAQTPEALGAQIKSVTESLTRLQRWKKNTGSGTPSEERRRRLKQAEADYQKQHDLLLELIARLQLWAYIADNLDHEHEKLTDTEVASMRKKEIDAISELRDVSRANAAATKK
jgi:hypothetical protein